MFLVLDFPSMNGWLYFCCYCRFALTLVLILLIVWIVGAKASSSACQFGPVQRSKHCVRSEALCSRLILHSQVNWRLVNIAIFFTGAALLSITVPSQPICPELFHHGDSATISGDGVNEQNELDSGGVL